MSSTISFQGVPIEFDDERPRFIIVSKSYWEMLERDVRIAEIVRKWNMRGRQGRGLLESRKIEKEGPLTIVAPSERLRRMGLSVRKFWTGIANA